MSDPVSKPALTFHAMLRYLQRVRDVNIDPYKGMLKISNDPVSDRAILELMHGCGDVDLVQLKDEILSVPGLQPLLDLGAGTLVYDRMRFVVNNGRLITVKQVFDPRDYNNKRAKRTRRQQRAAARRAQAGGLRDG